MTVEEHVKEFCEKFRRVREDSNGIVFHSQESGMQRYNLFLAMAASGKDTDFEGGHKRHMLG